MTATTAIAIGSTENRGMDDQVDPAERPRRRRFTPEFKAEVLAEYEALPKGSAERGELLRRHAIYSSHIAEWRKAAEAGAREGLAGRSKKRRTRAEIDLVKANERNDRLVAELERTKLALEITGKAHALLELISESADTESRSKR